MPLMKLGFGSITFDSWNKGLSHWFWMVSGLVSACSPLSVTFLFWSKPCSVYVPSFCDTFSWWTFEAVFELFCPFNNPSSWEFEKLGKLFDLPYHQKSARKLHYHFTTMPYHVERCPYSNDSSMQAQTLLSSDSEGKWLFVQHGLMPSSSWIL